MSRVRTSNANDQSRAAVSVGLLVVLMAGAGVAGWMFPPPFVGPVGPAAPQLAPPQVPVHFQEYAVGAPYPESPGIVRDRQAVTGTTTMFGHYRASIWTPSTGTRVIGMLPGDAYSWPKGVSADGAVVVGESSRMGTDATRGQAFRWTETDGIQRIDPPAGSDYTYGPLVSGNGTAVFGMTVDDGQSSGAFRWTAAQGTQAIPLPDEMLPYVLVRATNFSGSVMGGSAWEAPYPYPYGWVSYEVPVVWTAGPAGQEVSQGTFERLPLPPSVWMADAELTAMNDSGTVIVGMFETFRQGSSGQAIWRKNTESGGWSAEALGGADRTIRPSGVSESGRVVIGTETVDWHTPPVYSAVVWTPRYGWLDLNDALPRLGVDLTGWTLTSAEKVSADGTRISGFGNGPNGYAAWTVTGWPLGSVP